MNRLLLLLVLFLSLPLVAQEIGTLTLIEGSVRLLRGTAVLQAGEGVRLRQGDIIESSNPGFVQLEFAQGTVVALGASSRLFLFSGAGGRNSDANKTISTDLVLLSGWLKGEVNSSSTSYRFESPLLAVAARGGTIVLHATPEATEGFVESGTAKINEVGPDGNLAHSDLDAKSGQFFVRQAGKGVTADSRLPSTFTASMPAPFRDTIPSLLSHFEGKTVAPKRQHEVTYAEAEPWLTMGRSWRRGFVDRFKARVNDTAFRKGLEDHLTNHPEWDPVLHPEKYAPKTPAQAPDSSHPGYSK